MTDRCVEYNDNCEGCQPTLADARTGKKLPEDSPEMQAVRVFWRTVPLDDKKACHRFWCFNSRAAEDMAAMERFGKGLEAALSRSSGN